MGSVVNPLSFIGTEGLINYQSINRNTAQVQSDDAQEQFLQLLLEKIYLRDFRLSNGSLLEESEEEEYGFFQNEISDYVVNTLMRQQLAEQIIEQQTFDLGIEGEGK